MNDIRKIGIIASALLALSLATCVSASYFQTGRQFEICRRVENE